MHELSICQALLTQVAAIADTHQAVSVSRIEVAIGPLAGIEPLLLERAFAIAKAGGIAEEALLILNTVPIMVSCSTCGNITAAHQSNLVCGHCRDWHTKLVTGDELLLSRVELVRCS